MLYFLHLFIASLVNAWNPYKPHFVKERTSPSHVRRVRMENRR